MSVRIDCWCITCDELIADAQADNGDWLGSLNRIFIVCPNCGNKRCPRAAHHSNPCSGSNEPGQPGSAYTEAATTTTEAATTTATTTSETATATVSVTVSATETTEEGQ